MPILAVVGITTEGKREVLGFRVGDRENQAAWEALLDDLKERGVKEIDLWVSDGNQTTLNAIASKFPPLLVSDVWFTRWKMCSAMCPINSVSRSNQS